MRFYNLEKILFDDRVFVPADSEMRGEFGIPILPDDAPALAPSQQMCLMAGHDSPLFE